jgi:hypothetical protein
MEILALFEFCGCFLELAALFSAGGTVYSERQLSAERKKARQNEQPVPAKFMWRFLLWLLIAAALLMLVITKWAAAIS